MSLRSDAVMKACPALIEPGQSMMDDIVKLTKHLTEIARQVSIHKGSTGEYINQLLHHRNAGNNMIRIFVGQIHEKLQKLSAEKTKFLDVQSNALELSDRLRAAVEGARDELSVANI